ncbi:uncharacterized protein LOC126973271 [Leptidea sinapis]|uniref:uncharacterized protein LOC126973271 n=1 Tax=Leptidea sinapis TaxID=189913 RepID=UPI00213E6B11|nr:uncharacterized protein LOC126973271 [Leptidea sinapis]
MALKMMQPLTPKLRHHSVRFSGDDRDLPKYKSLDTPENNATSYGGPQSYPGVDSGAPSPDSSYQPAAQRFRFNEQRIKLLTAINQIVQQRADLESNRVTLSTLLDDLRRKLKRRIDENHYEKREKLKALKQANQRLEKEKHGIVSEIEHLKHHLEKEESHHVQHARNVVVQAIQGVTKGPADFFSPCSVSLLPDIVSRNVAKNAPSKLADNKLAAARLMRDIVELRQRLAQVEAKLANEMKRKRQVEIDIIRLRKELSSCKSNMASLRLLPPATLSRNTCSKFA